MSILQAKCLLLCRRLFGSWLAAFESEAGG
jgi:hypothetical protein